MLPNIAVFNVCRMMTSPRAYVGGLAFQHVRVLASSWSLMLLLAYQFGHFSAYVLGLALQMQYCDVARMQKKPVLSAEFLHERK